MKFTVVVGLVFGIVNILGVFSSEKTLGDAGDRILKDIKKGSSGMNGINGHDKHLPIVSGTATKAWAEWREGAVGKENLCGFFFEVSEHYISNRKDIVQHHKNSKQNWDSMVESLDDRQPGFVLFLWDGNGSHEDAMFVIDWLPEKVQAKMLKRDKEFWDASFDILKEEFLEGIPSIEIHTSSKQMLNYEMMTKLARFRKYEDLHQY